jgi:hypothetical protein
VSILPTAHKIVNLRMIVVVKKPLGVDKLYLRGGDTLLDLPNVVIIFRAVPIFCTSGESSGERFLMQKRLFLIVCTCLSLLIEEIFPTAKGRGPGDTASSYAGVAVPCFLLDHPDLKDRLEAMPVLKKAIDGGIRATEKGRPFYPAFTQEMLEAMEPYPDLMSVIRGATIYGEDFDTFLALGAYFSNLTDLALYDCNFLFADIVEERKFLSSLLKPGLKRLKLSCCFGIAKLLPYLPASLEVLVIEGYFDEEMLDLSGGAVVDVSHCRSALPRGLRELKILSSNNISLRDALPEEVVKLTVERCSNIDFPDRLPSGLKEFSGDFFETLPPCISSATKLEKLSVIYFPSDAELPASLKEIRFLYGLLEILPAWVRELPQLEKASFVANRFFDLSSINSVYNVEGKEVRIIAIS